MADITALMSEFVHALSSLCGSCKNRASIRAFAALTEPLRVAAACKGDVKRRLAVPT